MFSAAGGDRGRRRLAARECAPISLLKRETAAPGQRETQGNPFDWVPPHPLLNDTDQGACGPPILDYTPGVFYRNCPTMLQQECGKRSRAIRQPPTKAAPMSSDAGKHHLYSHRLGRTR